MIVFPAIDLIDGRCVRLQKGDYATASQVADSVLETAQSFEAAGASWIHMVDLDAAKSGKPQNGAHIFEVAAQTGLSVQTGGGIRDLKTIETYLENGVKRVILGSVAAKNPNLVKEAVTHFKEHIAVGIDAKNGMVATSGWIDDTDISYIELAKRMEDVGVSCIIFTDIAKDGMLGGPNFEQLAALQSAVSCDTIASGGVSTIDDMRRLREQKLYGAICGKALYTGAIDLKQAIGEAE